MANNVKPPATGTKWVKRTGDHSGLVNTVTKATSARVYLAAEPGTGGSWGGGKTKSANEGSGYSEPLATFYTHYEPYKFEGEAGGAVAFRQRNEPKPKPVESNNGHVPPPPGELSIKLETITPSMAAAWLARGGDNRKMRERWVNALSAAILRGEWRVTGEAIKLDADGRVRDGQHRLAAIVKSNTPVETLVVRNVAPDAFNVMDTGRSRSIPDILVMNGYSSVFGVAGGVRIMMYLERYGTVNPGVREAESLVNSTTTLEYLDAHPDVLDGFRLADRVRAAGLQGGVSVWTALFATFLRIDAGKANEFAGLLISGAGMKATHPALMLRNRAMNRNTNFARSKTTREELAAMVIKAWNAFRQGKSIEYLAYRTGGKKPESFPTPI